MHASARKPALVLSLVAALLAALVLALSPAAPAYAAEEAGTYADGSAGFFRWLGDDVAASVAEGQGVTGSASTKYLKSAIATRELTSSPFNLDAMKTSLEILQKCNECRALEGLPALKVDTQLMAYSQVAAAWASNYQSDSSVTADPHAAFREFGTQGKADAENIAYNYTSVDTAFWQWYTDEKAEYLAGNVGAAGHYLNIVNEDCVYFGAAYSKKAPGAYNTYEQTFGTRRRGLSYDVDTFIAKFNEYYALVTQTEPVEPPATSHDVILIQPANGRLIEYSNSHEVGAWVVVYVEPNPGYEIDSINVSGGVEVDIRTDIENPNYKAALFYMPDNDVTVSATIVKSGENEVEHAISVDKTSGGTVALSQKTAAAGTKVYVSSTPDEGYEKKDASVTDTKGNAVALENDGQRDFFVMPDADVTVRVTFGPLGTYHVGHDTPAHGRIVVDPSDARQGDRVTIVLYPDNGYILETVAATNATTGESISLSGSGTTRFFTMPGADVRVTATFKSLFGEDEGDFSDVADGDWYAEAVAFVSERGLMTGYEGTDRFGPDDFLNREQAATVLFRALGAGEKAPDCGLDDVEQGDWYAQAVNWAVSTGLITGYSNGSGLFGVGDALTRDQFAVIIARAAGADLSKADPSALDDFSDGDEVAEWAAPAMAWAARAGILTGSGDGHGGMELRPTSAINRAEMATMIMRASLAGLL